MISGIYAIINTTNGFMYIGQSVDVGRRWVDHIKTSTKGDNKAIYQAIEKDGIENFSFKILEQCPIEELDFKEKYYIDLYRTFIGFEDCRGYNMTIGGKGVTFSSKSSLIFKNNSIIVPIDKNIMLIKNSLKIYIYLKNMGEFMENGDRLLKENSINKTKMAKDLGISLRSIYDKLFCLEKSGYIQYNLINGSKYISFPNIAERFVILNTSYSYVKNIISLNNESLLRVFLFHKSMGRSGEEYYPTLQYIAESTGYSPTHLQRIIDCNAILEGFDVIRIRKEYVKVNGATIEKNYYTYLKAEKEAKKQG